MVVLAAPLACFIILNDTTLYGSSSIFKVMPFLISDVSTATLRDTPNDGLPWGTKAATTVVNINNNKVRDWSGMVSGLYPLIGCLQVNYVQPPK
jgi:hypothetical protein